ncbi:YjjG family noncanonical pyrimidine nucleotidase [Lacticaseibacillus camelliae]|uniref:Hydrolase (HAD superfamily) protein n=1 Tax=Lacticaseibacillus camelliae DSM 22697 = JCM 13995 TaxID=1423730 RepID=A0A0R2F475_9LACO|nr:YjjG family noncanonical pyrimidine nucleotidase [Lacticaseibacillus camelliae]KRN23070.1 hydrolase (HAD superfamily) protein [Lacticaseibacillus camelliae DSM 22697 = JCM 13995]
MYNTILFDVDDTLLDFKAGELICLEQTIKALGIQYTPALEARYLTINAGLWEAFEAGKIPRDQIFTRRFTQLFAELKVDADGLAAEKSYHKRLDQQAIVLPHVPETLEALRDYRLYIVSNGIEPVQHARLTKAKLIDYFADIFVSDVIGAPKPTVAFFDYVTKRIPHFNARQTLIVGDSLTSDVQGGLNAKIDSVWFNPHLLPNRTTITPVYQLSEFSDLTKIVAE